MLILLLAVLALGVLVGARGMRALGRSLRGPWRPGALAGGVLASFAALALASRALWIEAAVAGLAAAAMLAAASRRRGPKPAGGMDRREAESVLGLAPGSTPAEVDAAYRRLIRLAHPDVGGTPGLARRLAEARAVLKGR